MHKDGRAYSLPQFTSRPSFSFAAPAADDARARVTWSVHLVEPNVNTIKDKQFFVTGFTICAHLTTVLAFDFRMSQISQPTRRFKRYYPHSFASVYIEKSCGQLSIVKKL
jgi:hypothetical protein